MVEFKKGDMVHLKGQPKRNLKILDVYFDPAPAQTHLWVVDIPSNKLGPFTINAGAVDPAPTFFEVGKTYVGKMRTGARSEYKVLNVHEFGGTKWAVAEYRFWSAVDKEYQSDEETILVLIHHDWADLRGTEK